MTITSSVPVATNTYPPFDHLTIQDAVNVANAYWQRVISGSSSLSVTGGGVSSTTISKNIATSQLLVPAGGTADYTPSATCRGVVFGTIATVASFVRYGATSTTSTTAGTPLYPGSVSDLASCAVWRFGNPGSSGVLVEILEYKD